jgi:hypothetical protein
VGGGGGASACADCIKPAKGRNPVLSTIAALTTRVASLAKA